MCLPQRNRNKDSLRTAFAPDASLAVAVLLRVCSLEMRHVTTDNQWLTSKCLSVCFEGLL